MQLLKFKEFWSGRSLANYCKMIGNLVSEGEGMKIAQRKGIMVNNEKTVWLPLGIIMLAFT